MLSSNNNIHVKCSRIKKVNIQIIKQDSNNLPCCTIIKFLTRKSLTKCTTFATFHPTNKFWSLFLSRDSMTQRKIRELIGQCKAGGLARNLILPNKERTCSKYGSRSLQIRESSQIRVTTSVYVNLYVRTAPLRLHEADFVEIQQKRD